MTAVREQLRLHPPVDDEDALRMNACVAALADTRASFRHRPEDMTLGLLLPRTPFGVQSQYDQGSPPVRHEEGKNIGIGTMAPARPHIDLSLTRAHP